MVLLFFTIIIIFTFYIHIRDLMKNVKMCKFLITKIILIDLKQIFIIIVILFLSFLLLKLLINF